MKIFGVVAIETFIDLGISFCRKGWLGPDDILNCWDAKRVSKFFAKQPT